VTAFGDLSLAEITVYLEKNKIKYEVMKSSEHVIILNAETLNSRDLIKKSGGLYKIGEIKCVLKDKEIRDEIIIKKKLDNYKFYNWISDKAKWCISTYADRNNDISELQTILEEYFKERIESDGVRNAKYIFQNKFKGFEQEIISDIILKKGIIINGFEILLVKMSENYFIGNTLEVIDNNEFIKRDLGRPVQDSRISISPKMARILVNLTGLNSNGKILDPFCGIGTILQEAAILGLDIYGSDIDKNRVAESVRNMKWLSLNYNLMLKNISDKFFSIDVCQLSSKFNIKVDGIVTEPILLPPLKNYPEEDESKNMLLKSSLIYENAIREIAKVMKRGCRLILVVPQIITKNKSKISLSLEEVFLENSLRVYQPSMITLKYPLIPTPKRDQKILRCVYVLEKIDVSSEPY